MSRISQCCSFGVGAPRATIISTRKRSAPRWWTSGSSGCSKSSPTADNETIASAASIWPPLAASQDTLAVEGLRFLQGWFAARPSGTEDVYKVYAESLRGTEHLERILAEAQGVVRGALEAAAHAAGQV